MRSSRFLFSSPSFPASSSCIITSSSAATRRNIDFNFQHNKSDRCFDISVDATFFVKNPKENTENNNNEKNFAFKVPYAFLHDHSITFIEPATLQRSIPVDYFKHQESENIYFSENVVVNYILKLVFFRRTTITTTNSNENENNDNDNKNSREWLVVPMESFFQLISARHGQHQGNPQVSVRLYQMLIKSLETRSLKTKQDLKSYCERPKFFFQKNSNSDTNNKNENEITNFETHHYPSSTKSFIFSKAGLSAVKVASGLTSGHLRLAVSTWLQNYHQFSSSENSSSSDEKTKISSSNLTYGSYLSAKTGRNQLWFGEDLLQGGGGEEKNSEKSSSSSLSSSKKQKQKQKQQKTFLVKNVISNSVTNLIHQRAISDSNCVNTERDQEFEKSLLKVLHSSETGESHHRILKTKEIVRKLEKYGFVVISDSVLEDGLPFPMSLDTAEEPTGVPSSGLVADLANHQEASARKVVFRRNGVEFLLKYVFGVLMSSHYGVTPIWGRYEKQEKSEKKIDHLDTAYLSIGIDLHTDSTYISNCPRLQGFGLIHWSDSESKGGKNVLVDGYTVADYMHKIHPLEFWSLAKNIVPAYYCKEQKALAAFRPVFMLSRNEKKSDNNNKQNQENSYSKTHHVSHVSFNSYDRAPLTVCETGKKSFDKSYSEKESLKKMNEFYRGYTLFGDLCHGRGNLLTTKNNNNKSDDEEQQGKQNDFSNKNKKKFELQLQPTVGQILIFDNYRCLHARTAFTGPRIMCGSYIGSDEYISCLNRFDLHL